MANPYPYGGSGSGSGQGYSNYGSSSGNGRPFGSGSSFNPSGPSGSSGPYGPGTGNALPFDNFNPNLIRDAILQGSTNPAQVADLLHRLNGGDLQPLNDAVQMLSQPVPQPVAPQPQVGLMPMPFNNFDPRAIRDALSAGTTTTTDVENLLEALNMGDLSPLRDAIEMLYGVPPAPAAAQGNLDPALPVQPPIPDNDIPPLTAFPQAFSTATMARVLSDNTMSPARLLRVLDAAHAPQWAYGNYREAVRIYETIPPNQLDAYLSGAVPNFNIPNNNPGTAGRVGGNIPVLPNSYNPTVASMARLMAAGRISPPDLYQSLVDGRAPVDVFESYQTALTVVETLQPNQVEDFLSTLPGYVSPAQLAAEGVLPQPPVPAPNQGVDPNAVATMVQGFVEGISTPDRIAADLRSMDAPPASWDALNQAAAIFENVPAGSMDAFLNDYIAAGGRMQIPNVPVPVAPQQQPTPQEPARQPPLGPEPFNGFDPTTIARAIESGAVSPRLVFDLIQMYRPGSVAGELTEALNILQHAPPSQAQVPPVPLPAPIPPAGDRVAPFDNWDPEVIAETIRAGDISPYDVFRMLREANQPPEVLAQAMQRVENMAAPVPAPPVPVPAAPVPAPAQAVPVPAPAQAVPPNQQNFQPFQDWNPAAIADDLQAGRVSETEVRSLMAAYGIGTEALDAALLINAGRLALGLTLPPQVQPAGGAQLGNGEIAPWQVALIAGIPSVIAATLLTVLGVVIYRRRKAKNSGDAESGDDDDDQGFVYDQSGRIISGARAGGSDSEDPESGRRRKDKGKKKEKKDKKRKGKERAREMEQRGPDTAALMKKHGPDSDEED